MNNEKINLPPEWLTLIGDEFKKPYMAQLRDFLRTEYSQHTIYPPKKEIFTALQSTLPADVKVVIIGQDPYHGPGQAHGLSFSVKPGIAFPPSLRNIFKELTADIGAPTPQNGDLTNWAKQGVLLLNATLTVREGQPNSHKDCGWAQFTDRIIFELNKNYSGIIYLLWGSFARQKAAQIDARANHLFYAPHPSPLSAHSGFLGCRHFSEANRMLKTLGKQPINWQLP